MSKQEAIERLRESKKATEASRYEGGKTAGRRWAETKAEYAELERLATADETALQFDDNGSSAYGVGEQFYFVIDPDSDRDRDKAAEFWEYVLGDAGDRLSGYSKFVEGFAEGAVEFWNEVESEL